MAFVPADGKGMNPQLQNPGMARMSFAFEAQALRGVRLVAAPGASSFDGWVADELEVITP
jgi:hypothetical protein